MEPRYSLSTIFEMLTKQTFADFHNDEGLFDCWLCGDEDAPSKEEVKQILRKLLERNKI